ncbi:MAG: MarR family transcriptional regulator, partial [Gammaproteobacteria bacterium]|nr:MarR family transcriptional regulator [Gammaproteobacteria bacterium]
MLSTTCHCTRLRRAAHAVTRLYDEALAATGLTVTQFSLLRTISRLDEPYITTLAEATGLERSTLGRNLRPLEKAGLV